MEEGIKAITVALMSESKTERARKKNLEDLVALISKCVEENDDEEDDPVFGGETEAAGELSAAVSAACRKALMMDEIGNVTLALRCWRNLTDAIEDEDSLRAISNDGELLRACVEALSESATTHLDGDMDGEEAMDKQQWSELVCDIVTSVGSIEDAMDLTKGVEGTGDSRRLSALLITTAGGAGEGAASSAIEALSDNKNATMLIKTTGFMEKVLGLIEDHEQGSVTEEGIDAVVSLSGALWNFSFQEGLREGMLKENPHLLVRMLEQAKKFLSCDASKKLVASMSNFTDDKELDRVIFESSQDIFSAIVEFEIARDGKRRDLGDSISDEDAEDLQSCTKYIETALDNLVRKGLVELVADAVAESDEAPTIFEEPSEPSPKTTKTKEEEVGGLKEIDLKRHNEEYASGLKADKRHHTKKPSSPPRSKKPSKRSHPKPHNHHRHIHHRSNPPLDLKVRLSSKIPPKPLPQYTLHDVASLLYHLNLTRYIKPFLLKNQIDGHLLSLATEPSDLHSLGVHSNLHALKLLEWIMKKKIIDQGRGNVRTVPLNTLNVNDVGRLIRNIGLGRYEAAFIQNGIDGEVINNVRRWEDMKFLGVQGILGEKIVERVKVWRVAGVGVDEIESGKPE
ncbi:hypothetical protein TrST_g14126 [Triparma strigata]|uniref:SAM domain-containing protein n=1 Tax=Triparma strigata TaxID=1606541 RepID=A0A9W7E9F7_9STRA|nr:hypothetical protein TrST_g14126 [Triparma strigata]